MLWRELFGLDSRSLTLFRVVLGGLLVADLALKARGLTALYTDAGVLPCSWLRRFGLGPFDFSLHGVSGSWFFQAALFLIAGAAAALLAAGIRPTLASLVSWVLLTSLQNRNPFVHNSGDFLLSHLVFWSIFVPWEEAISLGRTSPSPRRVLSVGTVALMLQPLTMYVTEGIMKGPQWADGTAISYALRTDYHALPLGEWLLRFPVLLAVSTVAVWRFEMFGPLLLVFPVMRGIVRTVGVALFVLFHLALAATLRLGLFSFVCIASVLIFLPREFWEHPLLSRLTPPRERSALVSPPPRIALALRDGLVLPPLVFVLLFTVGGLLGVPTPRPLLAMGEILHLNHVWAMFAGPKRDVGWHVLAGRLASGRAVDILRGGAPLELRRPDSVIDLYPTKEWLMYMLALVQPREGQEEMFRHFAEYTCRTWNAAHRQDPLVFLEIDFVAVRNLPEGRTPPRRISLWRQACASP